jgi:replicative superfamily II helicase
MKTLSRELEAKLRIVAISATVPNIADLGKWLKDQTGQDAEIR